MRKIIVSNYVSLAPRRFIAGSFCFITGWKHNQEKVRR